MKPCCAKSRIFDVGGRWSLVLELTLRESNQYVDHVAKLGASRDLPFEVFRSPPMTMVLLMHADAAGVTFLR